MFCSFVVVLYCCCVSYFSQRDHLSKKQEQKTSGMADFGSCPLLDRLTNDEFICLLPHLSLEHSFLTQIFLPKKKWIQMLDVNFQTLKIYCGCCEEQVRFDCIKNHLSESNHLKSLRSNVKQFYHPFYTFGKADVNLAKGAHVSQKSQEMALLELSKQMKSFKKDFDLAKKFSNMVQSNVRVQEDDRFLQLSLQLKVENPDEMFVMVCLPFNDVPKLNFCNDDGKWHSAFDYKYLAKSAHFYCNICGINCSGIESLNLHLKGYKHKLRQLKILTLRHDNNSLINKSCSFYFGDELSYSVKKESNRYIGLNGGNDDDCGNSNFLPNISKEIDKKVNALNEYASKIFPYTNRSDLMKSLNNDADVAKNLDCDEYMGHLGVEYVLKIMKNESDRNPEYECGLCEFLGDERKMQRHLLNYDHKKKYLDLHYSDTIKKYENLLGHMRYMEFRAVISEIVDKIAIEVEKQHSRSLPYTVSLRDYNVRRPDLIAEVYALLHASQNRGPSFSNIFSKDDLKNLKNSAASLAEKKTYKSIEYVIYTIPPRGKVYLNKLSHDPVVRLKEYTAKVNKIRSTCRDRSISPLKNTSISHNNPSHSRNHDYRSRSRSPISSRCRSPIEKQNIWDIYRRKIAEAANDIEIDYEGYRKNPESHPLYEEEWNNFWQQRKRELGLKGINHRTYNFQPEWVHYFKQRIETLFGEELQQSQLKVRRKLEIPLDAEEDSQRSQMLESKIIEDSKELGRYTYRNSFDSKEVSLEKPFKAEICEKMVDPTKSELIIRDNHSNVVHVLRLMTALEEHLGSLGEKIMNLLSHALQMEKTFRGNSNEFEAHIVTAANCQLLETAVEKLKGILFAGLLDKNKIVSFNRVIQSTTNLLKYAEKMGWRQDVTLMGRNLTNQSYRNMSNNLNSNEISKEKPLSDTLMDLINVTQTNKGHMNVTKERYINNRMCLPQPTVEGAHSNPNLFAAYKGQSSHSGLASFDTKLSLDSSNHNPKKKRDQFYHSELAQFQQDTDNRNISANILNNNNFKNNNETKTNININTRTGSNIGDNINSNNGSSQQFRNLQFTQNLGQKNIMYQGGGGGNRNQNWSHWNNI